MCETKKLTSFRAPAGFSIKKERYISLSKNVYIGNLSPAPSTDRYNFHKKEWTEIPLKSGDPGADDSKGPITPRAFHSAVCYKVFGATRS